MDITVKEGGFGRRLAPIDKLKINTTDNKQSTWVPADKSNIGVLHASENGIYIASEDGYEAYSEVIVRVTKDSFEGDTSFDDWDYETPDMDLDNWDPETIEDFELYPDDFDDVFNNEDEWKDIDKPIDIKMDNPKIKDTKISGIDPVTGNEMEVGLDEDGYLTESTLPSSIKIEVLPDKLQYVDGQPILFRGMVVKAYTADGELWTDESHPDGILTHSELTFPVNVAERSSEEWDTIDSDDEDVKDYVPFSTCRRFDIVMDDNTYKYIGVNNPSGKIAAFHKENEPNSVACVEASPQPFTYYDYYSTEEDSVPSSYTATAPYTHNGKTIYYSSSFFGTGNTEIKNIKTGIINTHAKLISNESIIRKLAWMMYYGDVIREGSMEVPVQYIRSDGEVLEDSFTIEVLPDPDGAHPQVDPSTVEWNHRRYKANEDLGAVEIRHGSVYMEGGAIYDVGAAVRLGMLEPVDNEIVP